MTDRLSIYNDALLLCGERGLASLTENTEPRRLLDQVWNNEGVIKCLELGQWHFAMRGVQVDYDPDLEPSYGYNRAFNKPDDWVITSAVCSDEFYNTPLTQYVDEAAYWYASIDTIYVRYVSDDTAFGLNYGGWPGSFEEFVAAHFASRVISKITGDDGRIKNIYGLRERLLKIAKNRAAMAEPTSFPATGSWINSRRYGNGNNDRGNRGNLIG